MAAAAGIAVGAGAWVVATATGVAALLAASALAFTVVKVVGAVYLLYLGVKSLRAALRGGGPLELNLPDPGRRGSWAAFSEGLLTNLLNPKAALFFVALVPQFIGAGVPALALSVVTLAGTIAWFLVVANVVSMLSKVFAKPAVRRAVDGVTGAALIGLGIKLAASSRP